MRTYLTKTLDQRATVWLPKAMLFAVLIAAMAIMAVPSAGADDRPVTFADLVEELSPAVVNVSTVQTVRGRGRSGRRVPEIPEGMPFEEFWDQFRDRFEREQEEPRQARSLGSGFVIDKSGIVITNNHVVEGADEITVSFPNRDDYTATVIGRDALSDIAVLQINHENGDDFPAVKWGNDEASRIGDWVMAIGNPFGQNGTVTAGIISARNRNLGNTNDVDFIQTDASINRGNSGGPLFNMKGEVIGVNTAIVSPSGGNVGIGFSIPSNHAKNIVAQLQEHGKVRRGWLGVGIQPLTEDIAETLGLDIKDGAMITRVEPDSPADLADLQEGDIIVTWDGKEVIDSNTLSKLVKHTPIDKAVDVVIIRGGERQTLSVRTGALSDEQSGITPDDDDDDERERPRDRAGRELVEGMELAPLNDSFRQRYELDADVEGVAVVRVSRRSAAYREGIRAGAVIVRVNQQKVESASEVVDLFDEAIDAGRDRALVLINLRGNTVHVPLRLTTDNGDD